MSENRPKFRLRGAAALAQAPAIIQPTPASPSPALILPEYMRARYAAPRKPGFKASPQQLAYFDWLEKGSGNLILEAVAGAGKSTTLLKGLRYMKGFTFLGAYNKAAAQDLKNKAGDDMQKGVHISTLHAFGMYDWRKLHPQVEVDDQKTFKAIERFIDANPSAKDAKTYRSFIHKMVSFGKQFLIGCDGKPSADNLAVWMKLVDHFGTDTDLPEDMPIERALEWVQEVYKASHAECRTRIDFDDMIYAPIAYNIRMFQNDWVLIDECQDINPARREMAKRAMKRNGRAVFVGDSRQAIYGFCHPPQTMIKTPCGHRPIEELKVGDPVIASPVSGEVVGFKGGHCITETYAYQHSGLLLTLSGGGRKVEMTPHHKVPAQLDPNAAYYTYMMRRDGKYRVGSCKAYAEGSGEFMLAFRSRTEGAEASWILGAHATKEAAREAEKRLLVRIQGCSFALLDDASFRALPADEIEALKILGEHGRMVDFPLLHLGVKHRFARNGAIITEACNLMDGMRFVFFSDAQSAGGKNGHRQKFVWTPFTISARHYSGMVYGITIPTPRHSTGGYQEYPLYFAGDDILVHNTGAGGDSIQRIVEEFKCERLPLTVTYRCPKAVVEYVHQWVSHIEAHPDAPEGVVRPMKFEQAPEGQPTEPWFIQDAPTDQDVIICRFTRPLIQTAYQMINKGIACKVEGRDIGRGLTSICKLWKITTITRLEERLKTWAEREIAKAIQANSEKKQQEIEDKRDSLAIFIARCRAQGKTLIADLITEIEAMFADDVEGMVTLCTGHKSKGREWPRVYWIKTADRRCSREWEALEEINVKYVIGTRAQQELILVPDFTAKKA